MLFFPPVTSVKSQTFGSLPGIAGQAETGILQEDVGGRIVYLNGCPIQTAASVGYLSFRKGPGLLVDQKAPYRYFVVVNAIKFLCGSLCWFKGVLIIEASPEIIIVAYGNMISPAVPFFAWIMSVGRALSVIGSHISTLRNSSARIAPLGVSAPGS